MGSQDERPATDLNSREPSEAVPRWCVLAGASLLLGLLSIGLLWWSLTTAPDPLVGMLLSAGAGAGLVLLLCGLVQRRWARQLAGVMAGRFNARVERAVAERTLLERSRLLNALAYDLRQPLYAMSLATQSLQHQRAMRRFGSTLDQLHKALEATDELLDTINTIALLESGAIQPRLAVFSVQAMLERIDRVHGPVASARGLHWTVTPSLEHARSDAILLERMLGRLITNAVRCTRQGGVLVSCRRRDTHLLIQVWDTGPGLNESELAHVFDLHYRGQTSTETENGVGLGLCIVHQAAQLLGIGLGVRSRVGHGTCFSLRVPLAQAAR